MSPQLIRCELEVSGKISMEGVFDDQTIFQSGIRARDIRTRVLSTDARKLQVCTWKKMKQKREVCNGGVYCEEDQVERQAKLLMIEE